MTLNNPSNTALFLDFDGTLVDFAASPEGVEVSAELIDTLEELNQRLGGALALVSGRSLESLASLVPLPLSMAGSHGAEWRTGEGPVQSIALDSGEFAPIKSQLLAFAAERGLIAEDKGHAVALHYRQVPQRQAELDAFIEQTLNLPARSDVRLIKGNCVREIQPTGVDKGVAIARFMGKKPFVGRQPVYIGDDTTDEDGFTWVNGHSGLSVKVGPGETAATERLKDCGEVFAFLIHQVKQLRLLDDAKESGTGADW